MARVTEKEARSAFVRADAAARRCGLNPDAWDYQPGSITYGRAWRWEATTHDAIAPGYLGSTPREALVALDALSTAWDLVARRIAEHAAT